MARRASDPSDCLPVMVMQPLARREEALDAAGGNSPTIRSSVACGVAGMLTNLPGSAILREHGGGWILPAWKWKQSVGVWHEKRSRRRPCCNSR